MIHATQGERKKRVDRTLRGCDFFEVALTLRVRIAAKPKVLRAFRLAERDGYNRVRKKSQALRVRISRKPLTSRGAKGGEKT
jgi:hypothetical protein